MYSHFADVIPAQAGIHLSISPTIPNELRPIYPHDLLANISAPKKQIDYFLPSGTIFDQFKPYI